MSETQTMILGLDIGVNSIGWALLYADNQKRLPSGIKDCGTRVFKTAMDNDNKLKQGRAATKNSVRREKRMIRRQTERRKRRMRKLTNFLQRNGFLPRGEDIGVILQSLDRKILLKYSGYDDIGDFPKEKLAHLIPYFIRKRALDYDLTPLELGRALHHLGHRRGFNSNRRGQTDENEDEGQIKASINELRQNMQTSNSRTLAEYFCTLEPGKTRIRERWTARQMYIDEFNLILDRQSKLLSADKRQELYNIIFYQRALKSKKGFIGQCTLEQGKTRAPMWHPDVQELRIYQDLNNLRIANPQTPLRELTDQERQTLADALMGFDGQLDKRGNLTISKAKKLLALPKGSIFSIEEGGEKTLKGHKTNAIMIQIFGDRWENMEFWEEYDALLDIRSLEKKEALKKRGMRYWKLNEKQAEELSHAYLPEGYSSFSLKAIWKILPDIKEGQPLQSAIKKNYPEHFEASESLNYLPLVEKYAADLRNPIVQKCLTELRQIINGIIRKYGKPDVIRVELARDIKHSNKEKQRMIEKNRKNEKERETARQKLWEELNIKNPSKEDVLRVQLAEECNWRCPYTGRQISPSNLIGRESQFDIEHIIPFSRSLDNSFVNKTLCYHDENVHIKRNLTPYEVYSSSNGKYQAILERVKHFRSRLGKEKLRRFMLTTEEVECFYSDFSSRQLNDTRYATKATIQYLALLYGGTIDGKGGQRIQGLSGGITYYMRCIFGLNGILNSDGVKSRDDHRHHAVDAIAIAMTHPGAVHLLTRKARQLEQQGGFRSFKVTKPIQPDTWPSFQQDVEKNVKNILVSHHINKKVRGQLHEETLYSQDYPDSNSSKTKKHIRKPLAELNISQVEKIVDPAVRQLVREKLHELGEKEPNKAFKNVENLPVMYKKDNTVNSVIKKVRISRSLQTIIIGEGEKQKNVVTGANHHMEIMEVLNEDGTVQKWEGYVISLLEAHQRILNNKPVIKRFSNKHRRFVFSIACGDVLEVEEANNCKRELFVVRTVPKSTQISMVPLSEAREKSEIKENRNWETAYPETLRKMKCKKYIVTPLGERRRAND